MEKIKITDQVQLITNEPVYHLLIDEDYQTLLQELKQCQTKIFSTNKSINNKNFFIYIEDNKYKIKIKENCITQLTIEFDTIEECIKTILKCK